jgi:hypothetical protein
MQMRKAITLIVYGIAEKLNVTQKRLKASTNGGGATMALGWNRKGYAEVNSDNIP